MNKSKRQPGFEFSDASVDDFMMILVSVEVTELEMGYLLFSWSYFLLTHLLHLFYFQPEVPWMDYKGRLLQTTL